MSNFNHLVILGRVVRDPKRKTTPSGVTLAEFSVAVTTRKGKDGGEDEVCFLDCEAWRKTAEVIADYTKKGSLILVSGWLKQDRWESDSGSRSKHKMVVDKVQLMPKNTPSEAPPSQGHQGQHLRDEDIPF